MKKWKLILGLLILFGSGVLVGALGTTLYYKQTAGYVLGEGQPGVRKMVMRKLVRDLDLTESSVRRWVSQAEIDAGRREGLTTGEREELVRLRKENRVLREERDILRRATASFARETR